MASAYLPQHDGLLPYFLIYAGASAIIHSAVCYAQSPRTSLRAFSGPASPVKTPEQGLLARVYGVKNIYTGMIRLSAAYALTNAALYDLAAATFAGVLFLYGTELLVYRTVRMKEGSFAFVTAGTGLVWMLLQRDWYLSS
ncbi:hypothetical protein PFICI_01902 [Pestalotiopsis fici W106-1]|uniref:Ergosterol biosynthetic protein 28 n=1 Tax=Pestalotiopsis fici (strain W106-1 / CGMCC3.15140) TaxID=1229662 RepID=W3XQ07_PESFW|nr:uncharacterized protein PFICI_01902 [Pestalotiopsis fici W106-1]ETS88074.1 hypothetical protein PFICI_01902 [Pestalotiopsis fici W106-1]